MHPHKAYQRAERALCAMAAIGVGKSTRSQDGPMNQAAVSKAYLRVENFLSLVQIDALLAQNSAVFGCALENLPWFRKLAMAMLAHVTLRKKIWQHRAPGGKWSTSTSAYLPEATWT